MEAKTFIDGKDSTLYVAATMEKKETSEISVPDLPSTSGSDVLSGSRSDAQDSGVLGPDMETSDQTVPRVEPRPVPNMSIAECITKISPKDGDYLKYIPDNMLTEEQKSSKYDALEREDRKINQTRPRKAVDVGDSQGIIMVK